MNPTRTLRLVGVGASCAALGAAGGAIANASAHGHGHGHHRAAPKVVVRHAGVGTHGPVVHADLVVAQRGGTFATVTIDRGFVQSINGDQLTIAEGTKTATYKTVTLTIPSDATIRNGHRGSSLSDLQSGQPVEVTVGPNGTLVVARHAPKS